MVFGRVQTNEIQRFEQRGTLRLSWSWHSYSKYGHSVPIFERENGMDFSPCLSAPLLHRFPF